MWGGVPGGYRETWNENVVLILMIETLEGVQAARDIAKVPGVDGLFAASGDLGNFSGYRQGDPQYEMLITEVVEAAQEAGKIACGPLRWMGDRPEFMCFQGGSEAANIRRGAQAEIQAANQRFAATPARPRITGVLANLTAECGEIVYEADCPRCSPSGCESVGGSDGTGAAGGSNEAHGAYGRPPGSGGAHPRGFGWSGAPSRRAVPRPAGIKACGVPRKGDLERGRVASPF